MATFERSLKLCQVINDRNIDEDVDVEIRKLLIEGVDINVQDCNRNNNTPLHLATQKSDKKCVRLLLKYKPNLKIRNGNGETPFDIAQSDEVRELLSSTSFDVVEKKFVREIEFQNLSLGRLKSLEADPAFKVLKITCCPNVQIVWDKLSHEDYNRVINKSSHLFVIVLETQEGEIENLLAPSADIKRPFIVQIISNVSKKSLIYYKEENSKQLIEINFNSTFEKEFLQKIQLGANCNFSLLIQAPNSNIFGTFGGSLLDVKLNNDEDRNEIVNCFSATNALCHRFFKLFDENLTEKELSARVNQTLKFPGDQSLLALLDLPFEFKDEVEVTDDQNQILSFVDSRNYNLIMLAIECNNRDALKILLRFPIDLSHVGDEIFWASDLCWDKQNFECLADLIETGSPYPDNFNASFPSLASSTASARIKSTMEAATAFHESIKRGDIEEVMQFIKGNPKLKHVYDSTNKSALTVALEYDHAEIYSLLLSEDFTPGVDDEYAEAFNNCNFKSDIRNTNRNYFKNAFDEPHLKRLLNRYKLSFSSTNREACSQVIQKMFLTLNEIPEMVPILKIVSCSEHLQIVFDFDCRSVQAMDPTVGSSSTGLTYPIGGFIYIGAKHHREGFFDVIGTIAHELTHYAMQLTYENNCKPYDDKVYQKIFKSIVNDTRKLVEADLSTDSIISTAFTCYREEVCHQELIVRVPHLMGRYKNEAEALKEAKRKNYRLFDFFRSKVLPDVKAKTKVLMHKLAIRKINSLTGTIEKTKKQEVQLKRIEIKLEDQIFASNAPQLTLGMLRHSLDDSSNVFVSIEQISYGNIRKRIGQLVRKDFTIVVDCTEMVQKHAETICNIRQIFRNSGKIFLVMAAEVALMVSLKLTSFKVTHAQHNWNDLADDSQELLLQKIVNFQGTNIRLNQLASKTSDALRELPLKEFCNSELFKIGDPLADPLNKFYLPRNFLTRIPKEDNNGDQRQNDSESAIVLNYNSRPQIEKRKFKSGLKNIEEQMEKFETIDKTLKEILVESKSTTVVIISDSAGTGKTSALHEIARNLNENDATRWTVLTDLKKHIETFKEIQGDFHSFQDFVTQIILAEKSSLEKELFAQFHQEGRANILLDGFDEISPHYKGEVLKALKLFTPKSGNQLWITTRSHLELELEKTLGQLSCSLQPLTEETQIEFLEKVWKSDTNSSAIIAKDLIHKLSSICDSKSPFIGLPILISMVAEIYNDPQKRNSMKPEKLSFFSIFKLFVEKNIDIWIKKGEIAEAERKEILLQSEGIVEVHRKIAIAHFFGDEVADVDVEYDDEQWTVEKLTRLGLIRYDESNKSLSFIHETFAEYFLTDFIVGNLRTKTRACDAVKILVKVLTEKDFEVIRLLLDQALKELNFNRDKKLCETVGKQLNAIRGEIKGVLLHISEECREEVFKFMLNTIKHVEDSISLINGSDEEEHSVLLINIAINSKTMIKTIFNFIERNAKLKIAKETVQALNSVKENAFHAASQNKNEEIFPTLHEGMRHILTVKEIMKMLREKAENESSVLHYAVAFCNENALNDLVKVLKEVFSNEEIKEVFFEVNTNNESSLHVAARLSNRIALKCFHKHLTAILNCEETKELIQQRGFEQRNIFHSACENKNEEILQTLYECMQKILTIKEIKKMLRQKNSNGWSLLHYAASYCNENALYDLVLTLREILSYEDMKEMLLDINEDGDNSLHLAARENNKNSLNFFSKQINKILNFEETKKLMQQKGFVQGNIFHSACSNKNEEIFPTLYEYAIKFFEKGKIKKMLRAKNTSEWNVLHYVAVFGNESALNDLLGILEEICSIGEIKEMLLEVNQDGNNTLHVAVLHNNKRILKSLLHYINQILTLEEISKLIRQRGFEQKNIFHSACFIKNEEILSTLIRFIQNILSTTEINEMLLQKESNGFDLLDLAEKFIDKKGISYLMKLLQNDRSAAEKFILVNPIDFDKGNTNYSNRKEPIRKGREFEMLKNNGTEKFLHSIFEDNSSFNLSTKKVPAVKTVIEGRPLFIELEHEDMTNFDNEPDEGDPKVRKSKASRSQKRKKIDSIFCRKNKSAKTAKKENQGHPPLLEVNSNQIAHKSRTFNIEDNNNFYFERQFIDKDGKKTSVEDLIGLAQKSKIMILCGDPCTGKTIVLHRIESKLRLMFPSRSIEYVDLKLIKTALNSADLNNSQEIADYLWLNYLNQNNGEKRVFIDNFLANNSIILIDSLNDSYESSQIHLNLFKSIKIRSDNQLWVACRLHLVQKLEDTLYCNSHKLLNLSLPNQQKFFQKKLSNNNLSAQNILHINRDFNLYLNFLTGNKPIGTNLLVLEALASTFKSPTDSIPEVNYFHTFDGMIDAYLKINNNNVQLDKSLLQKVAFKSEFETESLTVQKSIEDLFANEHFDTNTLNSCGLVSWTKTGKVFFIYQTIAKFLIADYFILNLFMNENYNKTALKLYEIYIASPKFLEIRKFTDDAFELLKFNLYSAHRETVSLNAERIFSQEKLHNIFHTFIKDDHKRFVVNIFSLLSGCAESKKLIMKRGTSSTVVENLWQFKDEQQKNTIMIAAQYLSAEFVSEILECAREAVNLDDSMFHRDSNGRSVFFGAMLNDKPGVFNVLINALPYNCDDKILKILSEKDKENNNFISYGIKKQEAQCLIKYQEIPKAISLKFGTKAVSTLLIDSAGLSLSILSEIFSPCFDQNMVQNLLQSSEHSNKIQLNNLQKIDTNNGKISSSSSNELDSQFSCRVESKSELKKADSDIHEIIKRPVKKSTKIEPSENSLRERKYDIKTNTNLREGEQERVLSKKKESLNANSNFNNNLELSNNEQHNSPTQITSNNINTESNYLPSVLIVALLIAYIIHQCEFSIKSKST